MTISDTGVLAAPNTVRSDISGYGTTFIASGQGSNLQIQHNLNGYSSLVNSGGGITIDTNGSERMRIDSSGNVGIGVTPSAWLSEYKALQLPYGTSLSGYIGGGGSTNLNHNAYFNGTNWKYLLDFNASRYNQSGSGAHSWYTAPVGTAGNDITWTNAMTLTNTGNLLVGTTTNNGVDKLQVNGSISASNVYTETVITVSVAAGATVTQEFSLPSFVTTYAVKATMYGSNQGLHAFANYHTEYASNVVVGVSSKFVGDYNLGSIDLQTKNNLPPFTYSSGNGLKGQCVVTNGDSVARDLVIVIKKII